MTTPYRTEATIFRPSWNRERNKLFVMRQTYTYHCYATAEWVADSEARDAIRDRAEAHTPPGMSAIFVNVLTEPILHTNRHNRLHPKLQLGRSDLAGVWRIDGAPCRGED